MKVSACILSAIVALTALSLASPLAAADEAGKTPLSIGTIVNGNLQFSGTASGKFTLELGASRDSGKLTFKYSYGLLRRTAAGQTFRPVQRTETFRGKSGTLVIRSAGRQFPVQVVNPNDPDGDSEVWTGTWSIVSGTGRYAGLKGGGGVVGIIQYPGRGVFSLDYVYRYEGLVTGS